MKKRGQVWVETVIYTLIAFVLIGLVLAFAKPKIQELQDKAIFEQSIGVMEDMDILITELIQGTSGNQRLIEVGIRKGSLRIDGNTDKIVFELEGKHTYSEPGQDIQEGNLIVRTEKIGEINYINITRDYAEYNITYMKEDELKIISSASTAYKILISNLGKDAEGDTVINLEFT